MPPLVIQNLTPPTDSPVKLTFDFIVNKTTTYDGGDGVLTMILYTMPGYTATRYSLMLTGSGKVKFTSTSANELGDYTFGTWYHAMAVLPGSAGGMVTITLTPAGGSAATLSCWVDPFTPDQSKYKFLQIQPGFGDHPTSDVYVDNVSLEPAPASQPKSPAPNPPKKS
jgi:hypothetical protein